MKTIHMNYSSTRYIGSKMKIITNTRTDITKSVAIISEYIDLTSDHNRKKKQSDTGMTTARVFLQITKTILRQQLWKTQEIIVLVHILMLMLIALLVPLCIPRCVGFRV